jgi:hypothetical protein
MDPTQDGSARGGAFEDFVGVFFFFFLESLFLCGVLSSFGFDGMAF